METIDSEKSRIWKSASGIKKIGSAILSGRTESFQDEHGYKSMRSSK